MDNVKEYIETALTHYYKKIDKLKKELKQTENMIKAFEEIKKRGETDDRL